MARANAAGRQTSSGAASPRKRRSAESVDKDASEGEPQRPASSDGRAVVTLSPTVAAATRRMGEQMGGVGTTEVVRRGLILLDLLLSLPEHEELVVRDGKTQQVDRLRFAWDTF